CLPMGRPALPVVLDTLAHLVIEGLAGGDIHHLQPRGTGQLFGKAALAGAGTAQNQFDQSVTPYAAANHGPPGWAEKGSREPRSFPQASKEASSGGEERKGIAVPGGSAMAGNSRTIRR